MSKQRREYEVPHARDLEHRMELMERITRDRGYPRRTLRLDKLLRDHGKKPEDIREASE